jgi:hypothetical protein
MNRESMVLHPCEILRSALPAQLWVSELCHLRLAQAGAGFAVLVQAGRPTTTAPSTLTSISPDLP